MLKNTVGQFLLGFIIYYLIFPENVILHLHSFYL